MGSAVILDLMGGVALLLWGLHMVHSGVVRPFGADLRHLYPVLERAGALQRNRLKDPTLQRRKAGADRLSNKTRASP